MLYVAQDVRTAPSKLNCFDVMIERDLLRMRGDCIETQPLYMCLV